MSVRPTVPGEDLPPVVAGLVSAVGIASAFGALVAWSSLASASVERSPPAPGPPAEPSARARAEVAVAASAPSASAVLPADGGARGAACPALVVKFRTESVYPSPAANAPLAELARWLVAHPTATAIVDGHADASGSEATNLRLSRQRAAFIGATMEAAGAPKARVTVRGFGAFWPLDEAPPDASWNRRVTVQTKGDACPRLQEEVIEP